MELSPQQDVYYIDTVSPIDYFIDTVTPSAIQLNKEKTMSIELDGPLYLGSNSLQQQVDQNTEDITELQSDVSSIEGDIGSLDNLATSDKSSLVNAINETLSVLDPTQTADYIKNSKGLESGEISTNASILPWVEEMSHSTFDRSKFTVVGSPNITDDGIVSGFSSSNYIILNTGLKGNNWKIATSFIIPDNVNPEGTVFSNGWNFLLNYVVASKKVEARFPTTDGTGAILLDNIITNFNTGDEVFVEIISNGNAYKALKVGNDEKGYTIVEDNTVSNYDIANKATVNLGGGGGGASYVLRSSIDLKQFSITADGVPVFSGNKTGVDTIKPSDYQVVDAPTISADGIASGFRVDGNYVLKTLNLSNASSLRIEFANIYCPRQTTERHKAFFEIQPGSNSSSFGLRFYRNSFITYGLGAVYPTSSGGATVVDLSPSFNTAENFSGYVEIKNNILSFVINDTACGSYELTTEQLAYIFTNVNLSIGATTHSGSGQYLADGSIDLNAFKIYVDGNLVYQPCLKIPFTLSKTGAKIVDSIYRDRVNDMAEQFGFANYYTLDEDNGNFTLPQVELYGLIGQRTLRDSYRNGINYWELYSNRDLEQGGSCTSGVEVTFARPFADTNYVLSVPYSDKSTTAFTPTQTGDWIAKGKGIL